MKKELFTNLSGWRARLGGRLLFLSGNEPYG